jgi:hypothetical protein
MPISKNPAAIREIKKNYIALLEFLKATIKENIIIDLELLRYNISILTPFSFII